MTINTTIATSCSRFREFGNCSVTCTQEADFSPLNLQNFSQPLLSVSSCCWADVMPDLQVTSGWQGGVSEKTSPTGNSVFLKNEFSVLLFSQPTTGILRGQKPIQKRPFQRKKQDLFVCPTLLRSRSNLLVSSFLSFQTPRFLRSILAVVGFILLLAEGAGAQVHLSTTTGATSSAGSLTISHTTGTQPDRLMLVGVSLKPEEEDGNVVPTVKYGGTSLVQVGTKWGNDERVAIFMMVNPPAGTADVVITLPSEHEGATAGVSTFASVDQSGPVGVFYSATGSGSTPSVNVESVAGNLVFDIVGVKEGTSLTAGTGQTERWKSTSDVEEHRGGSSTKLATGSSTTMSWSLSSSKKWTIAGVAIKGKKAINTYSNPGIYVFTVPSGVTAITAETWGGGGRGGEREALFGLGSGAAGGGGGGAYSRVVISVTPGQVLTIGVGAGSNNTLPGGDSWVSTTSSVSGAIVLAKGGNSVPKNNINGATGGQASAGIGSVKFSGGNGAKVKDGNGGGGGASAGIYESAQNAVDWNGSIAPIGGANGGNGAVTAGSGGDGYFPGSGGGGGKTFCLALCTGGGAGNGGDGKVVISYAGAVASSPGGVPNAAIWFKADAGVNQGGTFTWADQSGNNRNGVQTTGANQPAVEASVFNYNPGLYFDGVNDHLVLQNLPGLPTGASPVEAFSIANHLNPVATNWAGIVTYGTGSSSSKVFSLLKKNFQPNAAASIWDTDAVSPAAEFAGGRPVLMDGKYTGSQVVISSYGVQRTAVTKTAKITTTAGYVGVDNSKTSTSYWHGYIPEIILFPNNLNSTQVNQVNSYLAIKYGITLDQTNPQNYLASDGTTIFWNGENNIGYKNNIAGIARDDNSALNQKQSKSANSGFQVAIGHGNTIAATNEDNDHDFDSNNAALMWGDNAASMIAWTSVGAPSGKEIVARKWKVQKTGAIGSVKVRAKNGNLSNYADHSTSGNKSLEIKSNTSQGQTFKFTAGGGTYQVNRLQVNLRRDADAPGQTITFSIRTSWAGADLATASIMTNNLTETYAWYNLVLSSPIDLTSGTTYYIRADNSGTGKVWWNQATSGTYSNGAALTTAGAADGSKDNLFRVQYATPDGLPSTGGDLVYLLVDDNSNFTSGATEIQMTLNNGFWEADVNPQGWQYFTFSKGCVFPVSGAVTDVTTCFGAPEGAIVLTHGGNGPFTYSWAASKGGFIPSGQTAIKNLSGLIGGDYHVTIIDNAGCKALANFTIAQPDLLSLAAEATSEFPIGAANGIITLTATGGISPYTFDWADMPGANNPKDRTGLSGGTYAVTIADVKGCTAEKAVVVTAYNFVYKDLYLSDPSQALDRIDPVASADGTTAKTAVLDAGGATKLVTFTQSPALCSPLTIQAGQTISITAYVEIKSGTMPSSPAITAVLKYGTTNVISLPSPAYNSSLGLLTWQGKLNDNLTIPEGQTIQLEVTTLQSGVTFKLNYDSQTNPSKVSLPVSTYIHIEDFAAYNSAYPGGSIITGAGSGSVVYLRAVVTDPFGFDDITGLSINLPSPGGTINATSVATAGCTRTYQYTWNTSGLLGSYSIPATAKEGLENTVTAVQELAFDICSPPVGTPIFATGEITTRCQGPGSDTYLATAANATAISYSLDEASLAAGNTLNPSTGKVSFAAGWNGTSIITATAMGCAGPTTATHTVITIPSVTAPVFKNGSVSERCKGGGMVTYTATANNASSITYALDTASLMGGNTINAITGVVTFSSAWSGTTVITATAYGCNGPISATYAVSIIGVAAIEDMATGVQSTPLQIDVLANDYCDVNPASVTILSEPANGFIQIDANGMITYLPNGTFFGADYFVYQVCTHGPIITCSQADVNVTIEEALDNPCAEATRSKTFYLPFPENTSQLRKALWSAANVSNLSNEVRTILSIKVIYPGTIITYDHWEDGYESDIAKPVQATTEIWGDRNPDNGWPPGYPDDIIPPGGYVIIDNQFGYNPRDPSVIAFDGKDKILSSNDIAVSKITGDAGYAGGSPIFTVQNAKTNVVDVTRYGKLFVIPFGEDVTLGNTAAFKYTGLFVKVATNGTVVQLDYNGDGVVDLTSAPMNEGDVWFYDGTASTNGVPADINKANDIKAGAVVTANYPVGVDLIFGGIDNYGTRNLALLPGSFYGDVYYSPVYTTLNTDPVYGFFTNSLATPIAVNWTAGTGANGTVVIPAEGVAYLELSAKAGYKFESENGESFTAVVVIDADEAAATYDWSFNMIPESRLSTFSSVAWAPGSFDLSGNYNPVWVTAKEATTLYIKYDGDLTSSSAMLSPCGVPYDAAVSLGALQSYRIFDSDKDQTGLAVYTCDGVKIAAVWGQDPSAGNPTPTGFPALDVGYVMEPRCLEQLILANDDIEVTEPGVPIAISVLSNDAGFLCSPDPTSVTNDWLLQPADGFIEINPDGSITYTPDPGFQGTDRFEYRLCATEYPEVCDVALVTIHVTNCFAHAAENLITGKVFVEQLADDGMYNNEAGAEGFVVNLYQDLNCNGIVDSDENIMQSTVSKLSGNYEFSTRNGYSAKDDFDPVASFDGNDGGINWNNNWSETGDDNKVGSGSVQIRANPLSQGLGNAIRLSGANKGINRSLTFNGATGAALKFSYMREGLNSQGEAVYVRINGSTIYTITDGGYVGTDFNYHHVTIPITSFNANGVNTLHFITNGNVATNDYFWIDNVELTYFKNSSCYVVKLDEASMGDFYSSSLLNVQTATFAGIGVCENHNYLGALVKVNAFDDVVTANQDVATNIPVLANDIVARPDLSSLQITLPPSHGVAIINPDGTVTYTPVEGYTGADQLNYKICALEDPLVCDIATVHITVSCMVTEGLNHITGMVYYDENLNGAFNNAEKGAPGIQVQLYKDSNGNGTLDGGEPLLSTQVTNSVGAFQFDIAVPLTTNTVLDQFNTNGSGGGNDGTANWSGAWVEEGESNGFVNSYVNVTGNQLRIRNKNRGAKRSANLYGAVSAEFSFDFQKSDLENSNDYLNVQVADNAAGPWTTLEVLTVPDGSGSSTYDITPYISTATTIRFISSAGLSSADYFYLDNVQIKYFTYDEPERKYIVKLASPLPPGFELNSSPTTFPVAFSQAGDAQCGKSFGLKGSNLSISKKSTSAEVAAGDYVTYTITVTNNGPTGATDIVVAELLPPGLTLVSATPSAGSWNNPMWTISYLPNQGVATLTVVAATLATLAEGTFISNTVTLNSSTPDEQPDDNDDTETIEIICQTIALTASAPSPVCEGEPIYLYANAPGITNWNWLGPDNFSSTLKNPVINSATIESGGVYKVTATASNGCRATAQATVSVIPAPNIEVGEDQTICLNTSTVISALASGGAEPYTYTWSNGLGTGASKNVTLSQTTTFIVTVTSANGCSNTAQITIFVEPCVEDCTNGVDDDGDGLVDCADSDCMPAPDAGSDVSICIGASYDLLAAATGSTPPYSFFWDNGLGSGQGHLVNPTATTTYHVTVTSATGCTAVDAITVTLVPCPEICGDGIDNDGDGLYDCDDPDCQEVGQPRLKWDNYKACPGEVFQEQVIFNDENLQYPAFSIASQPSNGSVSINNQGVFVYSPNSVSCGPDVFVYQVCNQVAGCCDTASVFLHFDREEPPVLANVPADLTIHCDDIIPLPPLVYALTGCPGIYISFEEHNAMIMEECPGNALIRTWTATDLCGNTNTASQTIAIQDSSPPKFFRVYSLPNEKKLAAGVSDNTSHLWKHVRFPIQFNETPLVFCQVVSEQESAAVAVRLRNISVEGFDLKLSEQELSDGLHLGEQVAWMAVEPGALNDVTQLQAKLVTGVSDKVKTILFDPPYPGTAPVFIPAVQTTNNNDPIVVRHNALSTFAVNVVLEEETSKDAETAHENENLAYLSLLPGYLKDINQEIFGETGQVDLSSNWVTVNLERQYTQPVVLFGSLQAGDDPATIRVRNVTPTSFEVKISEWDYLDGTHAVTPASFMVAEGSFPAYTQNYCSDNAAPLIPGVNLFASDNCDVLAHIQYDEVKTYVNEGLKVTRTWSTVDICGNSAAFSRTDTCGIAALEARAYLYGATIGNGNSTLMRDDLRKGGFLPLTEPYSAMPGYLHKGQGGSESIAPEVLNVTGPDAIVDWVFIEIRDASKPDSVVATRSALLQRDGDIISTTGGTILYFPELGEGYYQVAVRHRNHLGLMTEAPHYLTFKNPPMLDFQDGSMQLNDNQNAAVAIGNGQAMWVGDCNNDRKVIFQGPYNDAFFLFTKVLADSNNTGNLANYILLGYFTTDLNMDGKTIYQGPGNDRSILLFNTVLSHPGNSLKLANFIVTEKLP